MNDQTQPVRSVAPTKYFRKMLVAALCALGAGALTVEAAQGPQPTICNRSCWGARAPRSISQMGSLTRAILHHTAGTGDYTTSYTTGKSKVRGIQNYHMDVNGWSDIAYHFCVNAGGHIYEGRSGSMSSLPQGAHDSVNANSFGFNVMGYYHPPYNQSFTGTSRSSLEAVIAWRMPSSWSPYGSGSYGGRTVGTMDSHRVVTGSACPGDRVVPSIPGMRDGVNSRKNGGGGTTAPRIDVFLRGGGNNLYQKYWDGDWSEGFSNKGGSLAGDPTSVSWGPNRIDVFGRGTDSSLQHLYWNGEDWSSWQNLGGGFVGNPDACSWGVNRIDVFARNSAGNLIHKWYSGGGNWSGWEDLGGPIASDPTAVSWGPGRIDVFARGLGNTLKHIYYTGNGNWSWEDKGGAPLTGGPDACSYTSGRLDVFIRNSAGNLMQLYYGSGGWSSWVNHGGTLYSDPGCTSHDDRRINIFGRGGDDSLYQKYFDGSNWSDWFSMGGVLSSGPDACSWSNTAGTR